MTKTTVSALIREKPDTAERKPTEMVHAQTAPTGINGIGEQRTSQFPARFFQKWITN
jgi:hypothetical protein